MGAKTEPEILECRVTLQEVLLSYRAIKNVWMISFR